MKRPLSILTFFGFLYRLFYLNEPYRCDEAYTYLNYGSKPFSQIISSYNFPNNHVFHSMLVHVTTLLFGFTPLGLRLPVLLAGTALISLSALLAYQIVPDRRIALITAFFTAVSPYMVFYSVNARGYMVQALLATAAACCYFYTPLRREPRRLVVLLSLLLSLILVTVPTGVVFVIPFLLYLLTLCGKEDHLSYSVFFGLVAGMGVVTAVVLSPVLSKILVMWTGAAQSTSAAAPVLSEAATALQQGILPAWAFWCFVLIGFWRLPRDANHYPRLFLLFLLLPVAAFLSNRSLLTLVARAYVPLFPFVFILVAQGLVAAADSLWKARRPLPLFAWVGALAILFYQSQTALAIKADHAKLFFPEYKTVLAVRDLTRLAARSLKENERIEGTDPTSDITAAAYTVETRGFKRFYGMPDVFRLTVDRVYLIGESNKSVVDFFRTVLDPRLWCSPHLLSTREGGVIFETHRLYPDQTKR